MNPNFTLLLILILVTACDFESNDKQDLPTEVETEPVQKTEELNDKREYSYDLCENLIIQDPCPDYRCCNDEECNDFDRNTADICENPKTDDASCWNKRDFCEEDTDCLYGKCFFNACEFDEYFDYEKPLMTHESGEVNLIYIGYARHRIFTIIYTEKTKEMSRAILVSENGDEFSPSESESSLIYSLQIYEKTNAYKDHKAIPEGTRITSAIINGNVFDFSNCDLT